MNISKFEKNKKKKLKDVIWYYFSFLVVFLLVLSLSINLMIDNMTR